MAITLEVYPHSSLEPWLAAFAIELGKRGSVTRNTLLPYMAAINAVMPYSWDIMLISDPYHTETFVKFDGMSVRTAIKNVLRGRSNNLVLQENIHFQIPQGVCAAATLLVEVVPIFNQSRRGAILLALTNSANNGAYPAVEKLMIMAGQTREHAIGMVSVANDLKSKIRDLVNGAGLAQ